MRTWEVAFLGGAAHVPCDIGATQFMTDLGDFAENVCCAACGFGRPLYNDPVLLRNSARFSNANLRHDEKCTYTGLGGGQCLGDGLGTSCTIHPQPGGVPCLCNRFFQGQWGLGGGQPFGDGRKASGTIH